MSDKEVLLVEDEPDIREMLSYSLGRAGFVVWEAEDAEQALTKLESHVPDIVLVDWMLPGMSGIDLVRRLRDDKVTRELPVIMLTARGEETDKLKGFGSGIDDYLTKPFSTKELIARLKAVLRRSGVDEGGRLQINGMCLDTKAHRFTIDGTPVQVGPTEFRLLEFFLKHPERVYSREQLLDQVWGRNVYVEERTVDVHILRLRKLLMPHGYAGYVQTVRGAGYRFSLQ